MEDSPLPVATYTKDEIGMILDKFPVKVSEQPQGNQ